jgi:ADP-ribose pyrophosphatase
MNTLENLKTESNINVLRKELAYEWRFVRVVNYIYTKWVSLNEHLYEVVERTNSKKIVTALTVTADEKIILINQYRIPQGRFCIESPAWLREDDDEPLEETARREILEETWYAPEKLVHIGKTPTSSWLTTEVIDCFIWYNCKKVSEILALDNAEDIQVLEVPLSEFDDFVIEVRKRIGLTIDSKVLFMVWEYRKIKANPKSYE